MSEVIPAAQTSLRYEAIRRWLAAYRARNPLHPPSVFVWVKCNDGQAHSSHARNNDIANTECGRTVRFSEIFGSTAPVLPRPCAECLKLQQLRRHG